ncbi:glycosyltransferase [Candidatus Parcubacteria bacterium]|nr:glycosyltransferase [Candidatus Parcubacteria bacterium]
MSKKILFVITKSNWGGAQRYVFNMARAMHEKGYEVSVAAGTAGLLADRLREINIPFRAISGMGRDMRPLSSDIRAFFSLARIIREEKPDILHLNSSKAGGMGALLGRILSVPRIIYTAHGWPTREKRFFLSRLLITFFSWLTAAFAHTVIAVSRADQEEASAWPFMRKKLVTIHNGVEAPMLLPREEAQQELGIENKDAWQLGTIAELHPNKNLSAAILAVAGYNETHTKKIEYTIISDGEERERLEHLIAEKNIGDFVRLAGFRKNATSLLSAFDAFLLPSIKEGLPLTLLEAGFAGLPTIATTTGGIPEIIEQRETGLLLATPDTASIADALAELFNEYSTHLGERLKEKVRADFSLERCVTDTVAVYER